MTTYEVTAVRYGTLHARKSELFYRFGSYGIPDAPQDLDYFFYLLRGGGRTVLVDTGFDPGAAAARGRVCHVTPRDALERLGVGPGDVDTLLITHFHWDHIGNPGLAPGAEILVPRLEVEFWRRPVARQPLFWEHTDAAGLATLLAAEAAGEVGLIPEDGIVAPGLRSLTVGGHAAGQQVLVVDTAGGPVVLASDAIHLYEELEHERPFGVMVDLAEVFEAYATVKALGGTVVVGHDPLVAEAFGGLRDDNSIRIA